MTAAFASITSEGGLLPADLLARIALLDKTVPGLSAADYRLEEGQRIGEAISRSWNRMLPTWRAFRTELALLPADDPATTLTRERFLQPLLDELKYGRVPTAKAIDVDGRIYAISHNWGNVPIHLLGARVSLEERTVGQVGAAKSSPHGLLQDLLNRSEPHLWGLLSNGLVLRLLRDHHSLTTQAYVEVDLEALFEGERYADFAVLWLVFHQSRIDPREGTTATCWLEKWFALSRDEGLSALDDLRDGVVEAIEKLGVGFLRHTHNKALLQDLTDGTLDRQDYYRELLRLAYRLIFLFSAEDREVLLDPAAPEVARARYRRFYATRRLRDLAGKSRGGPHGDLWQSLRAVMNGLDDGCAPLALPALGSFLWSKEATRHLDRCEIANADLLAAVQSLSYLRRHNQRFPVSWRTVAADELGSIYESLLELHPTLDAGAGTLTLETVAGNERKKTGSYYTPTSLVDCLLDSALTPVIEAAVKGKSRPDAELALLALKIVDPACGSGHFLVAAARRLAHRLATVRTGDEEPSPRELQRALRDVVGRCVYGVDINEMAVELCKVALWMEAVEPGKPLSFLDAHIQLGNSLLGSAPASLALGIPDDAWEPLEGDDLAIARALKKRNRDARKAAGPTGQSDMWAVVASPGVPSGLANAAKEALSGSDEAVTDVRERKRRWEALQNSTPFRHATFIADAWCSAFVWPKQAGPLSAEAPTTEAFTILQRDPSTASKTVRGQVQRLAAQYRFFHWHLAFPEVFGTASQGSDAGPGMGFDCVLGNPPWERVKLQEKEFFAGRNDAIANAENASIRKKLIGKLPDADPALWEAWLLASRQAEGESHFIRQSGRFPLCGKGDVNTYAVFAELNRCLMGPKGRVGCVVPGGIATDDTTKDFFADVVTTCQLASLYHFENEEHLFSTVHNAFRFCLLTFAKDLQADHASDLVFFARQVAWLAESERHVSLRASDFLGLNPNSRTCPTFRWRRDAEINKLIYSRLPILWRDDDKDGGNPWGLKFLRMFDMSNDSGLFRSLEQCTAEGFKLKGNVFSRGRETRLALYEAKMLHLFDHRFGTYDGQTEAQANKGFLPQFDDSDHADSSKLPLPYYWVDEHEVSSRLDGRWTRPWLLAWRDITGSEKARTVIASLLPRVAVGHTAPLLLGDTLTPQNAAFLLATLSSLIFDYCARQKIGGTHLTYAYLKQLPVPSPATAVRPCPWSPSQSILSWVGTRALELVYTADDLSGFARDFGFDGPPFPWSAARRETLRAELDACFLLLFGISAADAAYVLDTFPIIRSKDEAEHGEYRTKRLVLERYDALVKAVESKRTYASPLDAPIPVERKPAQQPIRPKRDGEWATPAGVAEKDLAFFTLLEVLRCAGGPIEGERVRLASILVRKPAMATPFMDAATQDEWSRLIGQEAAPLPANVLDLAQFKKNAVDHAWRDAVAQLTGSRVLVCDSKTKLWSVSPGLPSSKQSWVEGRAEMAMRLVRTLQLPKVEKQIASFLKDVKRGATAQALIS